MDVNAPKASASDGPADPFTLPGRFDLGAARDLRTAILDSTGDIRIDAAAVTVMTTPGLQVLMAARPYLERDGRALRIVSPSKDFRACAKTLGVPLEWLQTMEPVR